MFQQPHGPGSDDDADDEENEAIGPVANHVAGVVALGDAEDGGGAKGKDYGRAEVSEFEGHGFLPIAIW